MNHLKLLCLVAAILLLAAGYVFLPKIREQYQAHRSNEIDSTSNIEIDLEANTEENETPGVIDREKLLAEWRSDRNLVSTDEDEDEVIESDPNAETFNKIKIIRSVPISESDVRRAHDYARAAACEIIPENEPVNLQEFKRFLTVRDTKGKNAETNSLFSRRHIASIGFDMLEKDKRKLPLLSANEILKFLDSNFLSLQVRIEKDPVEGTWFLHPRPLATLAQYRKSGLTQPPRKALADSLKNYRGIGMFLENGEEASIKSLRTMVMIHRSERQITTATGAETIEPRYELIFVRAVTDEDSAMTFHTFVTKENRTELHYLRDRGLPSMTRLCTIRTMLLFTKFSNLSPVESVTAGSEVDSRTKLTLKQLDDYVRTEGKEGSAMDNLTFVLDSIIRGKVKNR